MAWVSRRVRAIVEGIDRARQDPAVAAIVITGAGRAFSAGADIAIQHRRGRAGPTLWTMLDVIENSAKPVVAAIHSMVLGGGLEMSLARALPGRRAAGAQGRTSGSEDRREMPRSLARPAPAFAEGLEIRN